MKVLLVSHSFEEPSRDVYTPNTAYSLGLAYLTAFLERDGHSVDVLWLDGLAFSAAQEKVRLVLEEKRPDVLGLQVFTMNRVASFKLIEECSQVHPQIRIVVGGIHVAALPQQIVMKYPQVVAVIGEGELIFKELLESFSGKGPALSAIKGIAFWDGKAVVLTPSRDLVEDLDSLPFPKHELFFDVEPLRTMAHVITTRGCPFMCSFCCLHLVSRRAHRKRSIDSVIEEIVQLKKKYPRLETVQIHDDIFTLDNARVIEFCRKIIPFDLGIKFVVSAKVKPVSEEMFSWMERAGFQKVMFGLETGSGRMMKSIRKGVTPEDVTALFQILRKFHFVVTTFLIVGFPGEDDESVNETIGFVTRLQKIKYSYIVGVGKLWVYPGTEVYEIMKQRGAITDEYWLTDKPVPYYTAEHSLDELKRLENRLLDHLSITRILTPRGFCHHFLAMPGSVCRFLMGQPAILRSLLGNTLKGTFPGLYLWLYRHLKKVS